MITLTNTIRNPSIALIELYSHSEVLLACLRMCKQEEMIVDVFTNQTVASELQTMEAWQRLKQEQIKFQKDKESIGDFLQQHIEYLKNYDLVIVLTATSDFSSWNFLFRNIKASALVIHNFNTFFYEQKEVQPFSLSLNTLKNGMRAIRGILKNEKYEKQQLLNNAGTILSLEGLDTKELMHRYFSFRQKTIYELPTCFTIIDESIPKTESNRITITIPGSITTNGKEFEMVYQALKNVLPHIQVSIKLVLLGLPRERSGQLIQDKFKTLSNNWLQVVCFEKFISRVQYEEFLRESDFMILPIGKCYEFGQFIERYGISSISGTVNDALLYATPALIPSHYRVSKSLKGTLFQLFDTKKDLEIKLLDWIQNGTYKNHQSKYQEHEISNFSLEKQSLRFKNTLTNLISLRHS